MCETNYEIDIYPKKEGECSTCKFGKYYTYYDGWWFHCHNEESGVAMTYWDDTCDEYQSKGDSNE